MSQKTPCTTDRSPASSIFIPEIDWEYFEVEGHVEGIFMVAIAMYYGWFTSL